MLLCVAFVLHLLFICVAFVLHLCSFFFIFHFLPFSYFSFFFIFLKFLDFSSFLFIFAFLGCLNCFTISRNISSTCAPTTPECTVPPLSFRVLLLERLQLPLPIAEAACEVCGDPVDSLGRHRAACLWTGRLKKRATPIELMVARILRETGAQVRYNAYLRDMNIGVSSGDERRVEVLAQDLPCFGGAQLVVDVTLVSALCSSREPQPHAAELDSVVLERARHVKEATYPELAASERCRLVVFAIKTGGEEAVHMVRQLAIARARDDPRYMTRQVSWAWERRWTCMLATTCTVAFAASLVEPSKWCDTWGHKGGTAPGLADLLAQDPR